MTNLAVALTQEARDELIVFCIAKLKLGIDPFQYAEDLESAADLNSLTQFEIPGNHTVSGKPEIVSIYASDFVWEDTANAARSPGS